MNNKNFNDYNLSEEVLKAIDKLGYKNPTEVQEKVIPIAMASKDIIVKSQTGSGKTASFAIPICENVKVERNNPQALILTPTRELCVQVKDDITNIGRLKKVRCAAIFGKQPFKMQASELKQRVHIVVGTPGRTLDHINRGTIKLDEIEYLVIDEADEMLNMGFIEQVEEIIKKLPENRKTMLFSATISEEIEKLCNKYIKNYTKIDINVQSVTNENIEDLYYKVEENNKFNLLNDITVIENPDSCIIFCNTRDKVENVTSRLKTKKYPVNALHGGMLQDDRLDVIRKFKRGEFSYLVATDVLARGIDVDKVSHIISYDIPLEKESYVHRIGRSGRSGSKGKAITLVTPYENRFFDDIEAYIGRKIKEELPPSKEEVEEKKDAFYEKLNKAPSLKKGKDFELNKEITKIHINAGKKKKIRVVDIVGAISNIKGVNGDDIGIIDVQDNFSYVDILNGKGKIVMNALKDISIKGKKVRGQKAQK